MGPAGRLGLAACIAGMAGGLAGPGAVAADWSVRSFFSLRLSGDTAFDNDAGDEDRLRLTGDAGAVVSARTPRSSYVFAPGVRGTLESGEDASLSDLSPRFNLGFNNRLTPLSDLSGNFSFLPTPVSESQFDDTGQQRSGGLQLTTAASLGLTTRLDPLNSLSVSGNARRRDFDDTTDPDLVDTRSFGGSLGWSHTLDPVTTLTLSGGVTYFDSDDGQESFVYSLTAGAQRQIDPRLTLGGSLGVSLSDERNGGTGAGATSGDDLSVNPTGSLNLGYDGKDYALRLGLSQAVDQNSSGDLVSQTVLSGSASYTINDRSSVRLDMNLRNQIPLETTSADVDRLTFRVSPSYALSLASGVEARIGYQLRISDDDDGIGVSNGAFLQISRSLDLLP